MSLWTISITEAEREKYFPTVPRKNEARVIVEAYTNPGCKRYAYLIAECESLETYVGELKYLCFTSDDAERIRIDLDHPRTYNPRIRCRFAEAIRKYLKTVPNDKADHPLIRALIAGTR